MTELVLIGIGAGHPDQITLEAIDALQRVDVFFVVDKGPERHDLSQFREAVCRRHRPDEGYRTVRLPDPERDRQPADYGAAVRDWHQRRAELLAAAVHAELASDGVGALLVWGDPALFDSTLRVATDVALQVPGLEIVVVPGISSIQALTARHRIPLNRIGRPVQITTGRRLAAGEVPEGCDLVVMLDGAAAFMTLPDLDHIYWGAYLGTPSEMLIEGVLADVRDDIIRARAEARERHGWIMDTYLIRRNGQLGGASTS